MNELNPSQKKALEHAMNCAAEYLAECGTTDLAALTPDQAEMLGTIIVCRYSEQDFVPF